MKIIRSRLPHQIEIRDEGPREFFQQNAPGAPTKRKLELINALTRTGVGTIQVTAFVSPKVAWHQDAPQVAAGLIAVPGVRYTALYIKPYGLLGTGDRPGILNFPIISPEGMIPFAATPKFLARNYGCASFDEAYAGIANWIQLFTANRMRLERVMLSTAWGDPEDGPVTTDRVLEICRSVVSRVVESGAQLQEITLADTTSFATVDSVFELVSAVRAQHPDVAVGLHLHDRNGDGVHKVLAGLVAGATRVDCGIGGVGGCPLTQGAGNIPTEDLVSVLHHFGNYTGIDLQACIAAAKLAEDILGDKLPGQVKEGRTIVIPE